MRVFLPAGSLQNQAQAEQLKPADGQGSQKEKKDLLNRRGRIVSVSYEKVYDGTDSTYTTASHYGYDIHGNVKMLLQESPEFATNSLLVSQQVKQLDYTYDLVSGNVHRSNIYRFSMLTTPFYRRILKINDL